MSPATLARKGRSYGVRCGEASDAEKAADESILASGFSITPFSPARSRRAASNSDRSIWLLPTETAIECPC